MHEKIPVYVITGFLGSGKTTLLLKMLNHFKAEDKRPGIVLNELGEVNVEAGLFSGESLIEMLNGCICCTIQEDLKSEIVSFLEMSDQEGEKLDVLLIEGTGIANPGEIVEALTHPALIDKLELKSIISLMDASQYLEYQSIFSSSKEIRTVLKQQITNSTLLLLNKIDLIDEKKRKKVLKKIQEVKKSATLIYETSYSEIPINILLEHRMLTTAVSVKNHEHRHDHHHHHHEFQAMKLDDIPMLKKTKLEGWLRGLPMTMVRAKGVIQLEDQQFYQFQFASNQLHMMKLEEENTQAPCIIVIGSQLQVESILESFKQTFPL